MMYLSFLSRSGMCVLCHSSGYIQSPHLIYVPRQSLPFLGLPFFDFCLPGGFSKWRCQQILGQGPEMSAFLFCWLFSCGFCDLTVTFTNDHISYQVHLSIQLPLQVPNSLLLPCPFVQVVGKNSILLL